MDENTSPLVQPTYIKKSVMIAERNTGAHSIDVSVSYPSDALPSWFAPLRSVLEDRNTQSMRIQLDGGVCYIITATPFNQESHEKQAAKQKHIIQRKSQSKPSE